MVSARRPSPRGSKKQRVYQTLRQEILALTLAPGAVLVENTLARRFAVSKAPIREALVLLQQDGLVESLPRKGYLVTSITMSDMRELIEMRAILDGAAAELAATRITPDELQFLKSLDFPVELPPDARGARHYMDLNRQFHVAIARASRNKRLIQLVERAVDEMARLFVPGFLKAEHGEIIDALQNGDGPAARAAAVHHILMTQDRVLKRETTDFQR
jgi:GntR family transcriptional regulator, rspAB operon transcriptional repressor